jgi:membrane peptidoglycan carboxypeptidase
VDTRAVDELFLDTDIGHEGIRVLTPSPSAPIETLSEDSFVLRARGLLEGRDIGPGTDSWTPWNKIPAVVPQAIVSAEDGTFWKHRGFDVRGIRTALIADIRMGRLTRGGSTISQQVVKNLFLNHDRTLSRKVQEAFLTWHLERHVPKQRILEIYLNMMHLGPGIYGIRDAGRELFDKQPDRLTLREAVFLGSILPNPNHFIRLYARSIIPRDRRRKMRNILKNMSTAGFIPARRAAINVAVISSTPPPRRFAHGG